MTIGSQISSMTNPIGPEQPSYLPLNSEKMMADFFYTLASININLSAPNLAKMYITIRSPMSSIMVHVGPNRS